MRQPYTVLAINPPQTLPHSVDSSLSRKQIDQALGVAHPEEKSFGLTCPGRRTKPEDISTGGLGSPLEIQKVQFVPVNMAL
jgi:hypothetical protein